jgi:hypothetical protein
MLRKRLLISLTCLAVLAQLAIATFAQDGDTLTNADIIRMAESGLSGSIIIATVKSAPSVRFDLSTESLLALKRSGVSDPAIQTMIARVRPPSTGPQPIDVNAPEKSAALAAGKQNDTVLRNFKTLSITAYNATFVDQEALKAALGKNKDFQSLNIAIVDDARVADVILDVSYTFAWDYPFSLKYQNSSVVLLTGKGYGPFSGAAAAASVADELTRALKPYRQAQTTAKK